MQISSGKFNGAAEGTHARFQISVSILVAGMDFDVNVLFWIYCMQRLRTQKHQKVSATSIGIRKLKSIGSAFTVSSIRQSMVFPA